MSLHVTRQGDVVVIEVEGQLIVGNRQELKQKVLDEPATSTAPASASSSRSPSGCANSAATSGWPISTTTSRRSSS
jgi:hypothetical protein